MINDFITEQWIAKAAGWKANKAGRALFKQGAVLDSVRKEKVITGTLKSGAKPLRVTVKIHTETDVDTVCPRMLCRRTGEICEHAVALMLHAISETKSTVSTSNTSAEADKPTIACNPLIVELPPNFPSSLMQPAGKLGGLSIRLIPHESTPTLADQNLTTWLVTHTKQDAPPMLGLRAEQALDFLSALSDHDRLNCAENRITISTDAARIPMNLHRDDDRMELSLPADIVSVYSDEKLYLWDAEGRHLLIHRIDTLWKPRYWQRLAGGASVFMTIKEFLSCLDAQNANILWADDTFLREIPLRSATPEIILTLDGSTNALTAKLEAKYGDTAILSIGLSDHCEIAFPLEDPLQQNHYLSRNREDENQAAGILMQAGFQLADPRGIWKITDQDSVIEFLTGTLPSLQHTWQVKTSNKLSSVKNNIVRIIPDIQFKGGELSNRNSGTDWLAFDIQFKTDSGKDIPKEIIQRMIASGKHSGTSKNGKQIILASSDATQLESLLHDTNPRQENGIYYAPKVQAAYLRRLKQHYQGSAAEEIDETLVTQLPSNITSTLRPYQKHGIAWLHHRITHEGGALLADDMGLGKTLQTLATLKLLGTQENTPHLIVCPTTLLGNWQAEISKWFPEITTLVLHGPKRKEHFKNATKSADVLLTSYALVARDLDFYKNVALHSIVIDEASIIRNPDTQAAKALCQLDAEHRIALTGTPVENAIRDLWSLFHFILPGYLGSRKDFKNQYEQPLAGIPQDTKALQRLQFRVDPFMLRRTKEKVATDLPPKIHQTIYCQPTPTQQKTYTKLLQQGSQAIQELGDINQGAAKMQVLTILLRLRQASCDLRLLDSEMDITTEEASAKIIRLLELLDEAKRGNHRVLIFSQFTSMLALIKQALTESNISFAYLDGATRNRTAEVEKFQSPKDGKGPETFLISLKAGGYGLNLTAADTVVHFDPWWNPAVEAQATDRAYRIGQTKPTTVYKFITKGTVEEKILTLQQKKQSLISSTLNDENAPMMQSLSSTEIAQLLE